jgi:HEAT repeat protein
MKEKDDDVLEKLVSGISKRKDDEMLPELLLQKLDKANDKQKDKIVTIIGNLGTKESADTLLNMLPKAKTEFKRSLLWTLGQLGATDGLKEMKNVLRYNEQLQRTAAFAILFLSDTDKEAAEKALSGVDNMDAKMARAILGDKDAIQSIRSGLNSYNTIQDIFGALDAATMVKDESFKNNLYDLLEYSDVNYYPTDRYVRHTAIGALVRILL